MYIPTFNFFVSVILVINLTHGSFVDSKLKKLSHKQISDKIKADNVRKCTDQIQTTFSTHEVTTANPKFYAKKAFLNMRISTNPEEDTFTFVNNDLANNTSSSSSTNVNYTVKAHAKAYYEFIFPFIKIDGKMEDPHTYCKRNLFKLGLVSNEEQRCLDQLGLFMSVNECQESLFTSMYNNLNIDKLSIHDNYIRDYANKFTKHFQPDNVMKRPFHFCSDLFNAES